MFVTMRSNKTPQKRCYSSSKRRKKYKNKERKKGRGGAERMKGPQPTEAGRIAGRFNDRDAIEGKIGHGSQLWTKFT